MVSLYEYDTATSDECVEDLREIIEMLDNDYTTYVEDIDCESLERKGLRLQYIAQRLQILQNEEE